MTSIQRWLLNLPHMIRHPDGAYVLYSDHVVAVEAAVAQGDEFWPSRLRHVEKRGYQQAIDDCIAAVEALPAPNLHGVVFRADAIAALRALLDGAE